MKILFRYFFKLLHLVLGPILLFADWLTTPKGVERPESEQRALDERTGSLALYQFRSCPFCIKTRRAIKRQSLKIETRDAQHDEVHRGALLQGGGEIKVPCLRISGQGGRDQWLYESDDIIDYLQTHYAS